MPAGSPLQLLRQNSSSLPVLGILPSHPPSRRGLFATCTRSPRGRHCRRRPQRPRPRVRAPAPSSWLVPASARHGLPSPPTPQHTSAAASGAGEGKGPGGRPGLRAGRGDAHAGLASPGPFPSRRSPGGRARRVTLGGGSATPFPSLAAPGPAGAPPVRLCGGLLDYVCPLRAPALAAGWRWGGKKTRRRRRRRRWRGGGGSQQGHGS